MNHRHRNLANKVYLPNNARYNQYLLAEFKITDQLLAQFASNSGNNHADTAKPYQAFYQALSERFFQASESAGIENVHFIANDKLPRVRFSEELRCWESAQQLMVFYNPAYHESYKSHFDGSKWAKKVSLLFLASGDDIRTNAADFHQKVSKMLVPFLSELGVTVGDVRLRDHQHLTYGLFARSKGVEGTHAHTLRLIKNRYQASGVNLPEQNDTMSYVVASLPITRRMLNLASINKNMDRTSDKPYLPLYEFLNEAFVAAAGAHKLQNGAFIANGATPIIRNSGTKPEKLDNELIKLGYDPLQPRNKLVAHWNDDELVDYAQLVFSATAKNVEANGHGKFMESVDKCLRQMAKTLNLNPERDEITVRFHQHLAYHVGDQSVCQE
ncbi:MAG: DUF3083 family protein [Algicola sp.]|nr:DUF3083 family protein [Algicola sp.]